MSKAVGEEAATAAGGGCAGEVELSIVANLQDRAADSLELTGADVGVLVQNEGSLRVGGFFVAGRNDVLDYQQSATGKIFFDIEGSGLNQFDRLFVDGGYFAVPLAGFITELQCANDLVPSVIEKPVRSWRRWRGNADPTALAGDDDAIPNVRRHGPGDLGAGVRRGAGVGADDGRRARPSTGCRAACH